LVATYDYSDADGRRLYSVLRYEYPPEPGGAKAHKTFKIVRWLDEHGWAWGLGDVERVLYRQREVLVARPEEPVIIVEGEKPAEAGARAGMLTTTCSEGAEKWLQVSGRHELLRDRTVLIPADNDEAGRAHALQVARDLAGVARSVRILTLPDLPEHGDLVEWLAAGGTKEQLLILALREPAFDAMVREPAPIQGENQVDFDPEPPLVPQLKAANAHLNQRLQLLTRTAAVGTQQLPASAVRTFVVLRHKLEATRPDDLDAEGMLTIYKSDELAKECGTSVGVFRTNVQHLAEVGALRKKPVPSINPGRDLLSIGLGPKVNEPESWALPEGPRQHGGKRPGAGRPRKCPALGCGSTDIYITVRTVVETHCRTCGVVTEERGQPREVYDARKNQGESQVDFDPEPQRSDDLEDVESEINLPPYTEIPGDINLNTPPVPGGAVISGLWDAMDEAEEEPDPEPLPADDPVRCAWCGGDFYDNGGGRLRCKVCDRPRDQAG
jgi:hypothetical protein